MSTFAIPIGRKGSSKTKIGAIAQLVEQRTENPCVPGSIPGGTTKNLSRSNSIEVFSLNDKSIVAELRCFLLYVHHGRTASWYMSRIMSGLCSMSTSSRLYFLARARAFSHSLKNSPLRSPKCGL